ncbi:glycoside hydrolase family 27 protein [Neokomagataea tanensis]|uniref:Alpha-galactosidase n=2 Tax=Neokomagataea TaxID=1223423 RepID=A0A4Y6V792_9PROT|nr:MULTISPECIES: glycoside hydrolase family 27 protein [Neokomagataea]QDH25922.1 glycoside hydrolase family 27 protein [Neokomagataea tanensis]
MPPNGLEEAPPNNVDGQRVTSLKPNHLAMTPPMGWNTWNKFACDITAEKIERAADAMVASGMQKAGYRYILIDDCWQGVRDKDGNIHADAVRFPKGIRALADYVHAKGLLLGIYSDAGTLTCGGKPGSRGHEFQDARQYAAWQVDYLKYDWCSTGTQDGPSSYRTMADALRETGRPIVFSICEWGTANPWTWGEGQGGNLWRVSADITDRWDGMKNYSLGVLPIIDLMEPLYSYAGPGHWNDPDMLEVGNGGMTEAEERSHFSLWAEMSAPLIAGNDLTAMSPFVKATLTNEEVIAVDQDALGIQGHRVARGEGWEVWSKPLSDGGRAVVLFNRSAKRLTVTAKWSDLGYPLTARATVRDLWKKRDVAHDAQNYSDSVEPHGVVMVRLKF